jgi:hypothetical protein
MASANAMNVSLGSAIGIKAENLKELTFVLGKDYADLDLFEASVRELVLTGGKMAKVIESSDHMERGDPRQQMELLIPKLTAAVLGCLGALNIDVDAAARSRLSQEVAS